MFDDNFSPRLALVLSAKLSEQGTLAICLPRSKRTEDVLRSAFALRLRDRRTRCARQVPIPPPPPSSFFFFFFFPGGAAFAERLPVFSSGGSPRRRSRER